MTAPAERTNTPSFRTGDGLIRSLHRAIICTVGAIGFNYNTGNKMSHAVDKHNVPVGFRNTFWQVAARRIIICHIFCKNIDEW